MNKDEIKKALEFCAQDDYYFCGGCSYDDVRNCNDKLKTDARELIIKQEQEIARLKSEYEKLQTNAEILARGVRDLNHENYELTEKIKQAKIDVLSELKHYSHCDNDFLDGKWYRYVFVTDIDALLEKYANVNHRY